jgi:hypothetical protein
MIYEALMQDGRGRLTTLLTQAARYEKDNRILPDRFDAARRPTGVEPEWIAPVGTGKDATFLPGGDTVHYEIPLPKRGGPLRVSVEACFQSVRPDSAAAVVRVSERGPVIVGRSELRVD